MCTYKVGDMVRVVLEPSEKNKDHFLTDRYLDIPLEQGGTYEVTHVGVYLRRPSIRLRYLRKSGSYGTWCVRESAISPMYIVEEELE